MEYSITHNALIELVKEEVSRVADLAYTEQGVSLYDAIAIFDRDAATINRMISDAVSVVYERFRDFMISPSSTTNTVVFNFYLPDMETSQEAVAKSELTRFLSLQVAALWFQERHTSEFEKYVTRANSALDKAERSLFTRKRVSR